MSKCEHGWEDHQGCGLCDPASVIEDLQSRLDTATGLLREWLAEFDCQRDGLWPCETTRAFLEEPCCRGLAPASECKCERERVVERRETKCPDHDCLLDAGHAGQHYYLEQSE